jgi:hypothetical protein
MPKLTRRELVPALYGASFLSAAPARSRMRSLDSQPDRYREVWRSPGRFTKNPDIIRFASGRLMLVYCDTDRHWSEQVSRITTLESTDEGRTWGKAHVIAQADRRKGEERWVTPRISLLRDGRVIVLCDHDDYTHVHEDQDSGIWMWTSRDDGRTWSEPKLTGIPGIEPDRIVELADGTLLVGAHMTFRKTRKLGQFVMRSSDGGATWKDLSVVASDAVHQHCEGAVVALKGSELACVMRENNHAGYPSYVSFSSDAGRTWSGIQPLPFSGDRPFAQQLRDGRVLVTYRNQMGNRGTHAWVGDLHRDAGYQVGATHYDDRVTLEGDALRLHRAPNAVTRYMLMPPENFRSDVLMEARLRVAGSAGRPHAVMEVARLGLRLDVLTSEIWLHRGTGYAGRPIGFPDNVASTDKITAIDMTVPRTISVQTIAGRLEVRIDGKVVMRWVVMGEVPLQETWFGRDPKSDGDVWFERVEYRVKNDSEPPFEWSWKAASGKYPDQYGIDKVLELRANPPAGSVRPDNGYSSWLEREDGSIYMVDYTTRGDPSPTSHIYSMRFSPKDFVTP